MPKVGRVGSDNQCDCLFAVLAIATNMLSYTAAVRGREVRTSNQRRCPSAQQCDLVVLECMMKDHSNDSSWSGMLVPDERSQFFYILFKTHFGLQCFNLNCIQLTKLLKRL